jgi:hypothetical protein
MRGGGGDGGWWYRTGVGMNVGTAEIGQHSCFPELVQVVCVAKIALKIDAKLAEWFSMCVASFQKGFRV